MRPTLDDGDLLLLRRGARVRPGDVVLVRLPDGPHGPRPPAVKRAVRREAHGAWWVESDAGVGIDSWTVGALPPTAVLARVVARWRTDDRPRVGSPPRDPV